MRSRAIIHVTGPPGSGKTTFVQDVLLSSRWLSTLAARCTLDPTLRRPVEASPARHSELERYRAAARVPACALYRFPPSVSEFAFFETRLMESPSEAVVLEGDCPVSSVDLRVFIAPPLPAGRSLLTRRPGGGWRSQTARRARDMQRLIAELTRAGFLQAESGEPWTVEEPYQDIENAGLVVVNVRTQDEADGAARLLAELPRLRQDEEVRRDVLGPLGRRIPITAVAADLDDLRHPGTRKAMARVKRAVQKANER
jgi:hypothetical protein